VIKEMQRQVGDLHIDKNGIARRGLLIRHLAMPSCGEDTKNILKFVRDEVSEKAFVNIMAQYYPFFKACEHEEISRKITNKEYTEALEYARSIGLTRAASH